MRRVSLMIYKLSLKRNSFVIRKKKDLLTRSFVVLIIYYPKASVQPSTTAALNDAP